MEKKKIAIIFGGRSSEHEVSCISVMTIIRALNKEKYDMILIGITKDGHWRLVESPEAIQDGSWRMGKTEAVISPDTSGELLITAEDGAVSREKLDVIFPVLHGKYGEDGTIQGLFEMSGIPYVGCGVIASSLGMDKFYTKLVVDMLGIRQAKYEPVIKRQLEDMDKVVARVEKALPYPVFVKPSNAGSSMGVSKAVDRDSLIKALHEAARHDFKILVEEAIVGREIECAVLGWGKKSEASGVGEILSAADFYDYDAKYNNADSKTVIDPDIDPAVRKEIRKDAVKIFKVLDGFGLARVDFFVEKKTGEVVFNEINTLPGFTSISMYPMLWKACGVGEAELVDRLIEMAEERP